MAWANTGERFFSDHFLLFLGLSFVYVPMVFGLKTFMRNREAFDVC